MKPEQFARIIIKDILSGRIGDRQVLNSEKLKLSRELGLGAVPSSSFILSHARPEERERVLPLLLRKPTRTASGVAVVAVQTSPLQACPGQCIYCPDFAEAPRSYTGREPASMRAIQCGFDPYLQVDARLRQLTAMGHPVSKVELIVQGATFPAMNLEYRRWFVTRCLDAMIDHGGRRARPRSLKRAVTASGRCRARPVGITYETRPDWCTDEHLREMMGMGATRVEIGVQTLSDRVLEGIDRGHSIADVAAAFERARGSGLKICAHMMLGLPGSDEAADISSFEMLFQDARFKPDELKIYPTLVIEGTMLHRLWLKGEYDALSDDEVLNRVTRIKRIVPEWVRIKRVMRDIPAGMVVAGPKRSDMRSMVLSALKAQGKRCRCIRCREVGRLADEQVDLSFCEQSYHVSAGREVFLSCEDRGRTLIAAFLRLSVRDDGACRVRELHTYGRALQVGERPSGSAWQHRGLGMGLLKAAEERGRDAGARSLRVTSGIGARDYYRRLGYRLHEFYVCKRL